MDTIIQDLNKLNENITSKVYYVVSHCSRFNPPLDHELVCSDVYRFDTKRFYYNWKSLNTAFKEQERYQTIYFESPEKAQEAIDTFKEYASYKDYVTYEILPANYSSKLESIEFEGGPSYNPNPIFKGLVSKDIVSVFCDYDRGIFLKDHPFFEPKCNRFEFDEDVNNLHKYYYIKFSFNVSPGDEHSHLLYAFNNYNSSDKKFDSKFNKENSKQLFIIYFNTHEDAEEVIDKVKPYLIEGKFEIIEKDINEKLFKIPFRYNGHKRTFEGYVQYSYFDNFNPDIQDNIFKDYPEIPSQRPEGSGFRFDEGFGMFNYYIIHYFTNTFGWATLAVSNEYTRSEDGQRSLNWYWQPDTNVAKYPVYFKTEEEATKISHQLFDVLSKERYNPSLKIEGAIIGSQCTMLKIPFKSDRYGFTFEGYMNKVFMENTLFSYMTKQEIYKDFPELDPNGRLLFDEGYRNNRYNEDGPFYVYDEHNKFQGTFEDLIAAQNYIINNGNEEWSYTKSSDPNAEFLFCLDPECFTKHREEEQSDGKRLEFDESFKDDEVGYDEDELDREGYTFDEKWEFYLNKCLFLFGLLRQYQDDMYDIILSDEYQKTYKTNKAALLHLFWEHNIPVSEDDKNSNFDQLAGKYLYAEKIYNEILKHKNIGLYRIIYKLNEYEDEYDYSNSLPDPDKLEDFINAHTTQKRLEFDEDFQNEPHYYIVINSDNYKYTVCFTNSYNRSNKQLGYMLDFYNNCRDRRIYFNTYAEADNIAKKLMSSALVTDDQATYEIAEENVENLVGPLCFEHHIHVCHVHIEGYLKSYFTTYLSRIVLNSFRKDYPDLIDKLTSKHGFVFDENFIGKTYTDNIYYPEAFVNNRLYYLYVVQDQYDLDRDKLLYKWVLCDDSYAVNTSRRIYFYEEDMARDTGRGAAYCLKEQLNLDNINDIEINVEHDDYAGETILCDFEPFNRKSGPYITGYVTTNFLQSLNDETKENILKLNDNIENILYPKNNRDRFVFDEAYIKDQNGNKVRIDPKYEKTSINNLKCIVELDGEIKRGLINEVSISLLCPFENTDLNENKRYKMLFSWESTRTLYSGIKGYKSLDEIPMESIRNVVNRFIAHDKFGPVLFTPTNANRFINEVKIPNRFYYNNYGVTSNDHLHKFMAVTVTGNYNFMKLPFSFEIYRSFNSGDYEFTIPEIEGWIKYQKAKSEKDFNKFIGDSIKNKNYKPYLMLPDYFKEYVPLETDPNKRFNFDESLNEEADDDKWYIISIEKENSQHDFTCRFLTFYGWREQGYLTCYWTDSSNYSNKQGGIWDSKEKILIKGTNYAKYIRQKLVNEYPDILSIDDIVLYEDHDHKEKVKINLALSINGYRANSTIITFVEAYMDKDSFSQQQLDTYSRYECITDLDYDLNNHKSFVFDEDIDDDNTWYYIKKNNPRMPDTFQNIVWGCEVNHHFEGMFTISRDSVSINSILFKTEFAALNFINDILDVDKTFNKDSFSIGKYTSETEKVNIHFLMNFNRNSVTTDNAYLDSACFRAKQLEYFRNDGAIIDEHDQTSDNTRFKFDEDLDDDNNWYIVYYDASAYIPKDAVYGPLYYLSRDIASDDKSPNRIYKTEWTDFKYSLLLFETREEAQDFINKALTTLPEKMYNRSGTEIKVDRKDFHVGTLEHSNDNVMKVRIGYTNKGLYYDAEKDGIKFRDEALVTRVKGSERVVNFLKDSGLISDYNYERKVIKPRLEFDE